MTNKTPNRPEPDHGPLIVHWLVVAVCSILVLLAILSHTDAGKARQEIRQQMEQQNKNAPD